MELVWKDIDPVRLIADTECTVFIEGLLPPPDGRDIAEVLDSTAKVEVEKTQIDADKVDITGGITVMVTALDAGGSVFAFESYAGYTHTVELQGARPGMEASVAASVKQLRVTAAPDGARLSADAELRVMLTTAAPLRVISSVSGVSDLELRSVQYRHNRETVSGSETLRMREELAEAGVAEVISCGGQVLVRDVNAERDGVSVSGVLTVSAVTLDGSGHTGELVRQVPFREKLNIDAEDGAFCTAKLVSLAMHTLGEEFALMTMEAEIEFTVHSRAQREYEIPTDAFSPSVGFDCLPEELRILNAYGCCAIQTQYKELMELPDNAAEIASALFASAKPVVTSVECGANEIIVCGVFTTTLVYESASGTKYAYTDDIPFSIPMPNESGCNMPVVSCECTVQPTVGGERTVQLGYTALLSAFMYGAENVGAVVGLAEKEAPARADGILIAFASQGDTVYDIAKRYLVPCTEVKRLNPDAEEPFSEGERLLLLV